jgi:hypothetical protein
MLVESAWTYRLPPRVAGELLERSRDLPEAVRAIAITHPLAAQRDR